MQDRQRNNYLLYREQRFNFQRARTIWMDYISGHPSAIVQARKQCYCSTRNVVRNFACRQFGSAIDRPGVETSVSWLVAQSQLLEPQDNPYNTSYRQYRPQVGPVLNPSPTPLRSKSTSGSGCGGSDAVMGCHQRF